jgi:hypothetical protein
MKKNIIRWLTLGLLLLSSAVLTVCRLEAADVSLFGTNMPPLDFHGFASQGFLGTTKYNYLGDDTRNGSFQFTEAGLNVSMNPFPRVRITAQGFLYDVGDYGRYQPFLDYASLDYTFNDYFGVRVGRFRRPEGIYNDIQDVDLARTFVLLPQGIYNATLRDLTASLDGADVFGIVPLSKAGTLSYETFAGYTYIATDSGLANEINNSTGGNITSFRPLFGAGEQVWWNTPVNGLRFGAALEYAFNFDYSSTVPTDAPPPFPATVSVSARGAVLSQQYSVEYLWKKWTFQAEYYNDQTSQNTTSPAGITHSSSDQYSWYASTAYRFNKWLEVGSYYNESYAGGIHAVASDGSQKDLALSFRFDPKPWWIIKVEGHYIRGTELLYDNANNPVRNDDGWFMLALKTTVSF